MTSLLLVGCGKMGGALLSRWEHSRPAGMQEFFVIEPQVSRPHTASTSWVQSLDALPAHIEPQAIVFAVKPQELAKILPQYRARFRQHAPLYLSIAAGKTLGFYQAHLGEHAHVVRAMPNTPAMIGEGITALYGFSSLPAAQRQLATQLMQAVGEVVWLEDEAQMNAITALSGSGPAYVFLFLESLVKAGVAAGLSEATAQQLALKTVSGSCALAARSHDSLETLRKQVTSPGGTTEAALAALMKDGVFEELVFDAIQRATERSKELSG